MSRPTLSSQPNIENSLTRIDSLLRELPHSDQKEQLSQELNSLRQLCDQPDATSPPQDLSPKQAGTSQEQRELAAVELEREVHNAPPTAKDVMKSLLMWQKSPQEHLENNSDSTS